MTKKRFKTDMCNYMFGDLESDFHHAPIAEPKPAKPEKNWEPTTFVIGDSSHRKFPYNDRR